MPIVLAALVLGGTATADERAAAPKSGTYAADVFVQSASGGGCLDSAGSYYAGVVNYGGLGGALIGIRVPLASSGLGVVSLQALKITKGVGTTSPSGTFAWKGAGVGTNWSLNGTFSGTITEVDGFSFVAQVSESYPNCSESLMIVLMRVAAAE